MVHCHRETDLSMTSSIPNATWTTPIPTTNRRDIKRQKLPMTDAPAETSTRDITRQKLPMTDAADD